MFYHKHMIYLRKNCYFQLAFWSKPQGQNQLGHQRRPTQNK